MAKGILIGFFCFCLFLCCNISFFYFFKVKRRFFAMVKIYFIGILIYIVLFIIISEVNSRFFIMSFMPLALFAFLNGAFLHFFTCYVLIYFIQVIDRSPSTRIMIEIESSSQKRLTLEQIKGVYSIDRKIYGELDDMVFLGYVYKEANDYIITPKGKLHMRIFKVVRDFLKLRRS